MSRSNTRQANCCLCWLAQLHPDGSTNAEGRAWAAGLMLHCYPAVLAHDLASRKHFRAEGHRADAGLFTGADCWLLIALWHQTRSGPLALPHIDGQVKAQLTRLCTGAELE